MEQFFQSINCKQDIIVSIVSIKYVIYKYLKGSSGTCTFLVMMKEFNVIHSAFVASCLQNKSRQYNFMQLLRIRKIQSSVVCRDSFINHRNQLSQFGSQRFGANCRITVGSNTYFQKCKKTRNVGTSLVIRITHNRAFAR